MSQFECSICYSQHKITQQLICPTCETQFCRSCQVTYGKGDCMACHMVFKQSFLIAHLGKTFIEKVLKPKVIEELMVEQKTLLKVVQPLVDWEKEYREQKKQTRFGVRMTMRARPRITGTHNIGSPSNVFPSNVFPCPVTGCRGFIETGQCGTCHIKCCLACREQLSSKHVCQKENIQSIALLIKDSRPCPRCCVMIHKTEGCDHMFCTNCRTHFNWPDGKVLKTSSNGHYLHLQRFSDNIPLRECSFETEGFPLSRLTVTNIDANLVNCLWDDSNSVRLIKLKKYQEQQVMVEYQQSLQDLQVKYLLGEIDEKVWSRGVYQHDTKKNHANLYGSILDLYLATIDVFQRTIGASQDMKTNDSVMTQYTTLVELCNQSFQSIQEEYGGALHHIRHPTESSNAPAFI